MTRESHTSIEALKSLAASFDKDTQTISNKILIDIPKFGVWSAASKPGTHHYGKNGLAQHTHEVISAMFAVKQALPKAADIPNRQIFIAGLFHDIGKVWDYAPTNLECTEWTGTAHKRTIHHISRSALVWSKSVDSTGLFQEEHDAILHAILSHHGCREWGSPVSPDSGLAWLLHLCDNLSARIEDCMTKKKF